MGDGDGVSEEFETETCVGCGLTVEVDSPAFLEWDADIVGFSFCPDCRPTTEESGADNARRAA